MRMSRTISLTLVGAAMLTACVTSTVGCNRRPTSRTTTTTDRTWYDANGNAIAENWTTNEAGKRVPSPHPCDKNGKPWATDAEGNPVPPTHTTTHSTTTHRSSGGGGLWIFGGSGYRGSAPATHSSSSSSSAPRSGGFGRTGASVSS
jgi:hypothetical protein